MNTPRWPFAFAPLALLCAAQCKTPHAAPLVTNAAPPPTQDAAAPPSPSPDAAHLAADAQASDDPCAPVLARGAQVLAAVPADNPWREQMQSFARCTRTARGAWAIVLNELRAIDDSPGAYEGTFAFVHIDAAGREVRATRAGTWRDFMLAELRAFTLFDYDGDGEPELLWSVRTEVQEGADSTEGGVMAFARGAIAPYGATGDAQPTAFEDVDNDGRPDLVAHAPYTGEGDDSPSDFTYEMNGPALLWHSLADGTFSRDDAAAQQYARRACAARNSAVFAASGEVDGPRSVACARLWGVAPSAVRAAIVRRCQTVAQAQSARESPRARCGDVRVLNRWATLAPPLTLR